MIRPLQNGHAVGLATVSAAGKSGIGHACWLAPDVSGCSRMNIGVVQCGTVRDCATCHAGQCEARSDTDKPELFVTVVGDGATRPKRKGGGDC